MEVNSLLGSIINSDKICPAFLNDQANTREKWAALILPDFYILISAKKLCPDCIQGSSFSL